LCQRAFGDEHHNGPDYGFNDYGFNAGASASLGWRRIS